MQPRRKQPPITIRSERALRRLKVLTRTGRSQAEIIEEALELMPDPITQPVDLDRWREEIDAILAQVDPASIMTMKEFDAIEYDENGDLR